MSTELFGLAMGCIFACVILPCSDPAGGALAREGFAAADPPREEQNTGGERIRGRTKSGTSVALKSGPVETTLEPQAERKGDAPKGLNEHVKMLKAGRRLHLVLLGLAADAPPGVLYAIYLDLPPMATPEQKRRHAVGTINFFNFIGAESDEAKKSPNRRAVSLDVTEVARQLQLSGKLRDKPVITIAPVGKPAAGTKPVVDEIRLIESSEANRQ
jgi:hypothetical protein